jgi:hypothetical protein
MTARKLRDLPGWDEAAVAAANRSRSDGSTYQRAIGDVLKLVGAFAPPPSVDHVTPELVRAMVLGMTRQRCLATEAAALAKREAAKVVSLEEVKLRKKYGDPEVMRQRGDWRFHWTASPTDGDPSL